MWHRTGRCPDVGSLQLWLGGPVVVGEGVVVVVDIGLVLLAWCCPWESLGLAGILLVLRRSLLVLLWVCLGHLLVVVW